MTRLLVCVVTFPATLLLLAALSEATWNNHGEATIPSDVPEWKPGQISIRSWPNPASARVYIAWELPRAQAVTVELFDVRGRRLRAWAPGVLAAGPHEREWNARDANGAPLPAGVYWIRVRGSGIEGAHKVLIAR